MSIDALPGPHDLILDSMLFDPAFYADAAGLSLADPAALADHYLERGWRQKLEPGPRFNAAYYLAVNEDVRRADINPLLHFLRYGRDEGRRPVPEQPRDRASPVVATLPSSAEWTQIERLYRSPRNPAVDVIVPSYRGLEQTLRCLHSVLQAPQRTPYRLVVVDDHGPDAALAEALAMLADRGWIDLHRTPRNLGFPAACNLGLQLHPERDIVLLNSDTQVYNDWLDRLRSVARGAPRVGTVTPLSNNAELFSYPRPGLNTLALELDDHDLDCLASDANASLRIEVPTGIGFCLYIRRACLADAGLFDAETFGFGYGEENDFCRRAARADWRNLLAANVFVRHYGAVSFGDTKRARVEAALTRVEHLHPGYGWLVSDFASRDPVHGARLALDVARLKRRVAGRAAFLFVTHLRGGGTERHVRELAQLLEAAGTPVFFCRPELGEPRIVRIVDPQVCDTPNLPRFDLARDVEGFADLIETLGIAQVHIHHLADFDDGAADFVRLACARATVPYDFTVHDYMAVCPRINLVDGSGVYCGEPDARVCDACVGTAGSEFGRPSILEWRGRFMRLLAGARRIFVPDVDVAARMRRYLPDLRFEVRPHPARPSGFGKPRPAAQRGAARSIVIVGAIGAAKGSALLLACARAALALAPSLSFTVVGFTDRDADFRTLPNVKLTGRYEDGTLGLQLRAVRADLAWFPAVWPETYSYTLSEVFDAGIMPVGFDIGAIASRIKALGWGVCMPLERLFHPDAIVMDLATLAIVPPPADRLADVRYADPRRSYYGLRQPALAEAMRPCL